MANNGKEVDYKDMAKKLSEALVHELSNLGYIDGSSLGKYFEDTLNLNKQQLNQLIKWSKSQ